MKINQILCSNCRGAGLELQPDGATLCRFCGTPAGLPGPVCPNCEEVNAAGAETCSACRNTLQRRCPGCGQMNWSGLDRCPRCGRSLDLVDFVSDKWKHTVHESAQAQAGQIQAVEEAGSQRRMAQLMAVEERRQQALQEAMARQAVRQRRLMTYAVVGIVIFVALMAIGLVLAALGAR